MSLFSDPQKNIEQCGIQVGQIIADFGAGSGFYALEAAKALSGTGKVYAIDVQKDLLVRLQANAHKENITNIDVIWGEIDKPHGTKIADGKVDLGLVCNILFQIGDKKEFVQEVKRVLVPGGKVLVVEWSESFGGIGPHEDTVVSKEEAIKLFQSSGFAKTREFSAGSHHYGIIFTKM